MCHLRHKRVFPFAKGLHPPQVQRGRASLDESLLNRDGHFPGLAWYVIGKHDDTLGDRTSFATKDQK